MGAGLGVAMGTTTRTASSGRATATTTRVAASVAESASVVADDDNFSDWTQCGLEDDSDEWEEWDGPQRIRTSQLTPAEHAKFTALLARIFSEDALLGKRIVFEPEDVMEVMTKVIPYLESEPMLIEDVPFDVSIVGDIHGQLHDLHRVFHGDEKDGKPGWECRKYVFLGDYVDRGRQSLEVIMALFCIKMLHPDDIFLLRGNHEFLEVNSEYGLVGDLWDRYGEVTMDRLFYKINDAFCYLSVAAIIGDTYFCAHGGISPQGFTRRRVKAVQKPLIRSTDNVLLHDIVWSDPAEGLEGTAFSAVRGTSIQFGLDELVLALTSMRVKALFRGHTRLSSGFKEVWPCCFSLFTATCTGGELGRGAIAVLDEQGKLRMRYLAAVPERIQWDAELRSLDASAHHFDTTDVTVVGAVHDDHEERAEEAEGINRF